MSDRSNNPKAQFLSLPWNLNRCSPEGEEIANGVPVYAINKIEVNSYVCPEEGINLHDITLHFNNGALSIQSKGNAIEVLKGIDAKKDGGLGGAFVQVNRYDYINPSAGGIGTGWVKQAIPKIVSVPGFLKQNA